MAQRAVAVNLKKTSSPRSPTSCAGVFSNCFSSISGYSGHFWAKCKDDFTRPPQRVAHSKKWSPVDLPFAVQYSLNLKPSSVYLHLSIFLSPRFGGKPFGSAAFRRPRELGLRSHQWLHGPSGKHCSYELSNETLGHTWVFISIRVDECL